MRRSEREKRGEEMLLQKTLEYTFEDIQNAKVVLSVLNEKDARKNVRKG